ncbi:MAG: helix-turn-helix domain-containing protein [Thermoanaerobaculales bacterium]
MERFCSTTEAARRLGLSREQVLRRIGRGLLAAEQVGGRWLVDSASVEHYRSREDTNPRAPTPCLPRRADGT